jgi:UDP-GlcNAc:undecaprenyl-phosphate GlcNAc-1-phosphate transferase
MGYLLAFSFLLGLTTTLVVIPVLLRFGSKVEERPAECHHTNRAPVPRWGGLALVAAFGLVELFVAWVAPDHRARTPGRNVVLLSSLAMFGLGFWDDLRPLGAKRKLLAQVLIAALVCCCGLEIHISAVPFGTRFLELGLWGVPLTILWLVAMTNLINLVDGLDGLAGGICLILMVLVAVVGHQVGSFELLASGMAGALAGFLRFNVPPAKIYLGDGGAYFLGFQLGLFSLINSRKGTVYAALVAPVFVLALPITDAVVAVLRRGLRGLPIFRPDRNHLHHCLIAMGFSRWNALFWIYGLELGLLLVGLAALGSSGKGMFVLALVVGLLLLGFVGLLPFSRRWFAIGQALAHSLGMRRQTRYALSLAQWLELEGSRHNTVEELWRDLVFAARRLGFISVRVTLNGSERIWQKHAATDRTSSTRHAVANGRDGVLEFKVRACPNCRVAPRAACRTDPPCELVDKGCISDPRVFELMSELLAESWTKAATQWRTRQLRAFAFESATKFAPNRWRRVESRPPTNLPTN